MRKNKLILSLLLILSLFVLSVPAYATNDLEKEVSDYNNEIHDLRIKEAKETANKKITEYDLLKELQTLSKEELIELGYDEKEIEKILSMDIEKELKKAIHDRSKLTESELKAIGYDEEQIKKLKNLKGDEELDEIAFALASVSLYNTVDSHYYDTSENTTYFIVDFGWSWSSIPVFLLTDAMGIGWNGDFHPNDSINSSYNYHYKRYRLQTNWNDTKLTQEKLYEKEINTCEDKFDLNGFYGVSYWVQSGWGTMALTQTDLFNNAKFSVKYGHNEIGLEPSISYPWGVGFGFTSAESVFQPSEIAYSATATTQP